MHLTCRFGSREYAEGVRQFLAMARAHALWKNTIKCPCHKCRNYLFLPISEVERHLFLNQMDPSYTNLIFHGKPEHITFNGDDSNDNDNDNGNNGCIDDIDDMLGGIHAVTTIGVDDDMIGATMGTNRVNEPEPTTFEKLLEYSQRPLYNGCTSFSKLSFILKLFHIKAIGGWRVESFDMVIKLLKISFPELLLLDSFQEAQSLE